VIEVHLVRGELIATIVARHLAKLPQEGCRRLLPAPNPVDLALAIRRVVLDILRALVAARRHDQF
jgi:hypothetical protein